VHTPLQYLRTSSAARLAAFGAALAAIFGIAALAGAAIGPEPEKPGANGHGGDAMPMTAAGHAPAGLSIEQDGYRLAIEDTTLRANRSDALRFRVIDKDGQPIRQFEEEHGARLHLIIVRRDLTGYQHLHPRLAPDGTWSIALSLPDPGSYRMFADFHANGRDLTLGADLFVPGRFDPVALPAEGTTAAVDGYEVELTEDDPGILHFKVMRDGREITDLQPYLGARGHLVALREGDLAYLHVHPEEGPEPGAGISFGAEIPSAGRYRLYLQFRRDGDVHTAELTR
jgi:hypothetical protein